MSLNLFNILAYNFFFALLWLFNIHNVFSETIYTLDPLSISKTKENEFLFKEGVLSHLNELTNSRSATSDSSGAIFTKMASHVKTSNKNKSKLIVGYYPECIESEFRTQQSIPSNLLNQLVSLKEKNILIDFTVLKRVNMVNIAMNNSIDPLIIHHTISELWRNQDDVWLIEVDSEIYSKQANTIKWTELFDSERFITAKLLSQLKTPIVGPEMTCPVDIDSLLFDTDAELIPNDELFNKQYALKNSKHPESDVSATYFWKSIQNMTSQEVTVAVIDTGINLNHEDLNENIELNPTHDDNDTSGIASFDFDGHGTMCAGIIAADHNNSLGITGIATKNVKVIPLQGLSLGALIEAINTSLEFGVKISSNSWGADHSSVAMYSAVLKTLEAGQLMVNAVDNGGSDSTYYSDYPPNFNFPNFLNVGSSQNEGYISTFSNYGAPVVHVFAPGECILSTTSHFLDWGYDFNSGTSFSTPLVAGIAAQLLALFPGMNYTQLKEAITETCTPSPYISSEHALCNGIVNAYEALMYSKEHFASCIAINDTDSPSVVNDEARKQGR